MNTVAALVLVSGLGVVVGAGLRLGSLKFFNNRKNTITKKRLIKLYACKEGLARFSTQTNNSEEAVTVSSLVGGENTVGDLIWLADKMYPRKKLVQFGINCAQLVNHLNPDPKVQAVIAMTKAWITSPTKPKEKEVRAASAAAFTSITRPMLAATIAYDSAYAAISAAKGIYLFREYSTQEAAYFTKMAAYAHSEDFGREIEGKINELLKDLFKE